MKKLLLLLVGMAIALGASAQSVPTRYNIVGSPFLVPGSSTTNLPTSLQPIMYIGANGFGVSLTLGATNAASTTNATLVFEGIADPYGTNAAAGITYTVSAPQTGTTAYYYWTNIVGTTLGLGNLPAIRLKSIQNTNLASIWITNGQVLAR